MAFSAKLRGGPQDCCVETERGAGCLLLPSSSAAAMQQQRPNETDPFDEEGAEELIFDDGAVSSGEGEDR